MGLCFSSKSDDQLAQEAKDRRIQRDLAMDMKKQDEIIKLLLLGAGESGKSTIFKQMKILYGQKWENEELLAMKPVVYSNIIQNMKLVIEYCATADIKIEAESETDTIKNASDDAIIDVDFSSTIKAVWGDAGIQTAWEQRSNFQVLDCLEYYCKEIDRICQEDYTPTEMDILMARVRTSGIVEEKYVIDGVNFAMFDVGGQRNERKKWIHCFDNVTAVIFVAAINEYDQVLYEDSQTNRIDEAVKLFEEICNSSWFRKTSMILFLNKKDIFQEKLFKIPLRDDDAGRNTSFEGPFANDDGVTKEAAIDAAQGYMLSLFTSKKQQSDKEIYSHVTCATDTRNVQIVFNSCKDIILRKNLMASGFMD